MRWPVWYVFLVIAVLAGCPSGHAQSGPKDGQGTGSVSGTVLVNGKPVSGVKVVALRGNLWRAEPVAVGVTDANGQYRLEGLAAGDCTVALDAGSFAEKGQDDDDDETSSKSITLGEGEVVEGIDLEALPGGVITGRVTDSSGRPIIGETVQIIPFKDGKEEEQIARLARFSPTGDRFRVSTDDRGVYRAYGLPAGGYRVSVGDRYVGKLLKPSFGRVPLPLTYYSGSHDGSRASVIKLAAGAETIDVDIRVDRPSLSKSTTYVVSGRVVDDAGRPLPTVSFSYEQDRSSREDGGSFSDWIRGYGKADAKGEFTIRDLPPGRYSISLRADADSPWYSDKAAFDVSSGDVEGLEITAKAAGSISGVAVLKGTNDPSVIEKFSTLRVREGLGISIGTRSGPIGKDGTFKITGIGPLSSPFPSSSPGRQKVFLGIDSDSLAEGFEVIRVERDGIEQQHNSVEVGPGENVSGVKLVVACYKGSVQGQITIQGGSLRAGGYLEVSATPVGQPEKDVSFLRSKSLALRMSRWRHGNIDARGRFVIERLPPGEYEINLDAYLSPVRSNDDTLPITVTRLVTLTGEDPAEVSLVLDLSKKQ